MEYCSSTLSESERTHKTINKKPPKFTYINILYIIDILHYIYCKRQWMTHKLKYFSIKLFIHCECVWVTILQKKWTIMTLQNVRLFRNNIRICGCLYWITNYNKREYKQKKMLEIMCNLIVQLFFIIIQFFFRLWMSEWVEIRFLRQYEKGLVLIQLGISCDFFAYYY